MIYFLLHAHTVNLSLPPTIKVQVLLNVRKPTAGFQGCECCGGRLFDNCYPDWESNGSKAGIRDAVAVI